MDALTLSNLVALVCFALIMFPAFLSVLDEQSRRS